MISQNKVRIMIVGCGGISFMHVNNLIKLGNAEIVGLCDVNPGNTKRLKDHFPMLRAVREYSDYREMYDSTEADAVLVLTPHTLHFNQAMDALKKEMHVLVEKPMTTRVEHAKKLVEKASEEKRILMVSYQRHYEPPFRFIKARIESGSIGEVQFATSLLTQEWMRLTKGTWRQDPELSGGGELMDSGSHIVDFILWSTGLKPLEVFAQVDYRGCRVDINTSLTVRFSNGALASVSIVGDAPRFEEYHAIYGTQGAIFYDNGKIRLLDAEGSFSTTPLKMPFEPSNPDRNFVMSILGLEKPESPGECGLRVIELTEAALESARRGEKISLRE
ncbi:MAG: Gfo/Idh/MocA family oxidoreductase [Candidatus Brockarchaeota archaeon]|nr:Gfo/Idh/MocA family oxidoreductase [Candidatus Brockarchaeota archaeon]